VRRILAAAAVLVALVGVTLWLYARGTLRLNYPSLARYPVRGIDVSHHQGPIDWAAVRAAGVTFAFIKSSEGKDHVDSEFHRNWSAAREAGVSRGAYHFFTFCSPGAAQAGHFAATVGAELGELPLVADVEFVGNCKSFPSIAQIRSELRVFLTELERLSGRRPLLYFTSEAQTRILAGHFDEWATFPRDVYCEPGDDAAPWLFWQFADNGIVPGISGRVDLDLFRGTRDELHALAQARGSLAP